MEIFLAFRKNFLKNNFCVTVFILTYRKIHPLSYVITITIKYRRVPAAPMIPLCPL